MIEGQVTWSKENKNDNQFIYSCLKRSHGFISLVFSYRDNLFYG